MNLTHNKLQKQQEKRSRGPARQKKPGFLTAAVLVSGLALLSPSLSHAKRTKQQSCTAKVEKGTLEQSGSAEMVKNRLVVKVPSMEKDLHITITFSPKYSEILISTAATQGDVAARSKYLQTAVRANVNKGVLELYTGMKKDVFALQNDSSAKFACVDPTPMSEFGPLVAIVPVPATVEEPHSRGLESKRDRGSSVAAPTAVMPSSSVDSSAVELGAKAEREAPKAPPLRIVKHKGHGSKQNPLVITPTEGLSKKGLGAARFPIPFHIKMGSKTIVFNVNIAVSQLRESVRQEVLRDIISKMKSAVRSAKIIEGGQPEIPYEQIRRGLEVAHREASRQDKGFRKYLEKNK